MRTSDPNKMEDALRESQCNDRGEKYVEETTKRQLWHRMLGKIEKDLEIVDRKMSTMAPSKKLIETKILRRIEAIETMTKDKKPIAYIQALRRAMTPDLVEEALGRYKEFQGESQTRHKHLAVSICSSYCRIFAILLKCGRGKLIPEFIHQGIDDSNLPLRGSWKGSQFGVSLKNNSLGFIEGWGATSEWLTFFTWQWNFLTPLLARPKGRVLHYLLESEDILPILPEEDEEMENSTASLKPPQILPFIEAYGGNSTVRRVKLDPLSCDFGDFQFQHRQGLYALKHLAGHEPEAIRKEFLAEVSVWKTFNSKSQENRLHISPLLCTFETGNNYYLLFPWATGDLWQLFETQKSSDRRFTESWMAKNCWKIAEALSVVHQDQQDRCPSNLDDYDEKKLYGRHGDIKPHNILWFADYVECEDAGARTSIPNHDIHS